MPRPSPTDVTRSPRPVLERSDVEVVVEVRVVDRACPVAFVAASAILTALFGDKYALVVNNPIPAVAPVNTAREEVV